MPSVGCAGDAPEVDRLSFAEVRACPERDHASETARERWRRAWRAARWSAAPGRYPGSPPRFELVQIAGDQWASSCPLLEEARRIVAWRRRERLWRAIGEGLDRITPEEAAFLEAAESRPNRSSPQGVE